MSSLGALRGQEMEDVSGADKCRLDVVPNALLGEDLKAQDQARSKDQCPARRAALVSRARVRGFSGWVCENTYFITHMLP